MVILREVLEKGYHLVNDYRRGHLFDEFREVRGRLPTDHGGLIVDKLAELLAELCLDGRRHLLVWGSVETAAGHLGGEPVRFGEADSQRDEVFFDLLGGQVAADLVEGLDGLFL